MKRTPWFDALKYDPEHIGMYECEHGDGGEREMILWDGLFVPAKFKFKNMAEPIVLESDSIGGWRSGSMSASGYRWPLGFGLTPGDRWRGVVKS